MKLSTKIDSKCHEGLDSNLCMYAVKITRIQNAQQKTGIMSVEEISRPPPIGILGWKGREC